MKILGTAALALFTTAASADITYDLVVENEYAGVADEIRVYVDYNGNRIMDEGERIAVVGGGSYQHYANGLTVTAGRFIDYNGEVRTTIKVGKGDWGTGESMHPTIQNFDSQTEGVIDGSPISVDPLPPFIREGELGTATTIPGNFQIHGWSMENVEQDSFGNCSTAAGVFPCDPRPFGRRGKEGTWSLNNSQVGGDHDLPGYSGVSTWRRFAPFIPAAGCVDYWALPYIDATELVLDTNTTPYNHAYTRPFTAAYCPQPERSEYGRTWQSQGPAWWGKRGNALYTPMIDTWDGHPDSAMFVPAIHEAVSCNSYGAAVVRWGHRIDVVNDPIQRVVFTLGERGASLADLNRDLRISDWEVHTIKQIIEWDKDNNAWADARNWNEPSKKFVDWWTVYSHLDYDGDGEITRLDLASMLADINEDGCVDAIDLGMIFAGWGSDDWRLDLNGDGVVGPLDHSLILVNWGCY